MIEDLIAKIREAKILGDQEAEESEPYKNRYAAALALQQLQEQLQPVCAVPAPHEDDADVSYRADVIAWCKAERGLQLLETDLLAEGQKELEDALSHVWPPAVECLAIQIKANNALAGLWCERSEHETALKHLQTAADLHCRASKLLDTQSASPSTAQATQQQQQQQLNASTKTSDLPSQQQYLQLPAPDAAAESATTVAQTVASTAAASNTPSSLSWYAALSESCQLEDHHTTTLFYMAQVHGLMGNKDQSAAYCAATLNRQLKQGDLDLDEWVQNCLQLSGCFLESNTFALSRHCCAAVEAVLVSRHQQSQRPELAQECDAPSGRWHSRDAPDQQQQQQVRAAHDESISRDQLDKKGQDQPQNKLQQHGSVLVTAAPSQHLFDALSLLDHDVAANVCLALAKLHLYCLVASHELHVEGKQVSFGFNSAAEVPSVLVFDALPGLPQLSSLSWGSAALATNYDGALQLFRAALPWFTRALEHYQLDGWVTEHCNILFEMSNLHRCLAGFESDPHKRCIMHRSRAKLLDPLEGQLSTTHYPGLSRSVSLELGNIFREIADIKAAAGREPAKVAAAMQSAAAHYKLFLDSFRTESGQLPERIGPEMQQHYLGGLFSMARMLQGLPGTGTLLSTDASKDTSEEMTNLEEAVSLLRCLVQYVSANGVVDWQEQAGMAEELSGLLQEKLALVEHMRKL